HDKLLDQMDAFEFNKFAGAILGTVLVVLVVGNIADIIYAPARPETPAYQVEGLPEASGEGVAEDAGGGPSPAALLAGADPERGQAQARKCVACHTFEEGGPAKIGPSLYGIVGGEVAAEAGFSYSNAMQAKAQEIERWGYEELSDFLTDPRGYVPGTAMAFAGIKNDQQRADLIAYLRTLSADPPPLPEVEAEAAAPAEGEAAGDQPAPAEQGEATGESSGDQATPAGQGEAAQEPAADQGAGQAAEP